jgi:hypothetical protein
MVKFLPPTSLDFAGDEERERIKKLKERTPALLN